MSADMLTHAAFLAFGLLFLACLVAALRAKEDGLAGLRIHYGVMLAGAACVAPPLMSGGRHAGIYAALVMLTAASGLAAAFLRRTERDAAIPRPMKRP